MWLTKQGSQINDPRWSIDLTFIAFMKTGAVMIEDIQGTHCIKPLERMLPLVDCRLLRADGSCVGWTKANRQITFLIKHRQWSIDQVIGWKVPAFIIISFCRNDQRQIIGLKSRPLFCFAIIIMFTLKTSLHRNGYWRVMSGRFLPSWVVCSDDLLCYSVALHAN